MLKLSLDALQVVDAIDRGGSFAAAAKELFRVPSTISYSVAKLEEDLGIQLFERAGPRVTLTAAGRTLLDEGRHLLLAARDLEHLGAAARPAVPELRPVRQPAQEGHPRGVVALQQLGRRPGQEEGHSYPWRCLGWRGPQQLAWWPQRPPWRSRP